MSAKNLYMKNRWRSKTVAFRVSPEEFKEINTLVNLSGLIKQDYLIKRALQKDITVIPSPRIFKALKSELHEVLSELRKIQNNYPQDELLSVINQIAVTLNGFKEEKNG